MGTDADKFINTVNDNYETIKKELQSYCDSVGQSFDEDIFQDTILKCYTLIDKQGIMKDSSYQGCKNFMFQSFKRNLKRETQYARNQKRDGNITNIGKYNEIYLNSKLTSEEKLKSDLRKDFFTLYLLGKVEENFDDEHFYLFRLKTFTNMTYAALAEKTGIKGCRQKVVDVKNWLKENVSKEEIEKAFEDNYGDMIS